MTVCVVGGGGREHALAAVLARSDAVVVSGGNPAMSGISSEGHRITVTSAVPEEVEADLFVIGPEAPLVDGLADRLRAGGRLVVGPGADGARLEGSKAFMKEMLAEAGVPTARFGVFDSVEPALAFLRTLRGPWVVKTDGLAAGKGVLVAPTLAVAEADVVAKLSGSAFGAAGRRVVIEEGLAGTECSLLALCDGTSAVPLSPARDAKRLGDGDLGPNTGGMGAFSPVPGVDDALVSRLMDEGVLPLVSALRARGIEYRGVLYAGVMLTEEGFSVLEFNVRFGDPEAQVVLPRLADDPVALLHAVASGRLGTIAPPAVRPESAVCVVMAADGYPVAPRRGDVITGLGPDGQLASPVPGVTVFHAGTAWVGAAGAASGPGSAVSGSAVSGSAGSAGSAGSGGSDGGFVTAGGRVLGVTGCGPDLEAARAAAYAGVAGIGFAGAQVRGDIAGAASSTVGVGGGSR